MVMLVGAEHWSYAVLSHPIMLFEISRRPVHSQGNPARAMPGPKRFVTHRKKRRLAVPQADREAR